MLKIAVQYALRNIMRTPLRSFFTLLSVALIISLYTIIDGVGDSFTRQITSLLGKHNADIIVQSKYSVSPLSSRISENDAVAITQAKEVIDYGSLAIGKVHIREGAEGFVIGVTDIEKFAHRLGLSMVKGRVAKNATEIIVASQLASILKVDIGDTINLGTKMTFRIVGLYETWIGFFNSSLLCDMQEAQTILHIDHHVSMLALALREPHRTGEIIEEINTRYPKLKAIRSSNFSNSVGPLKALFVIMHIISMVTLVIASAILLNTFIMAISERNKEIAILQAIGWSRKMIMMILMIESVLLSLIGGVIGFLITFPVLYLIKEHYQSVYVYMPPSVGIDALGKVIMICVIIGIVSVLLPALYGTKRNVAKALHDK